MCEIWNELQLKKPPIITVQGTNTRKVQQVRSAISRYLQMSTDTETEFAQTAALLSRLMARRKNSFRRMIVFKTIQKINSANLRLLNIDLPRDLNSFFAALPDNFEVIDANVELPTRNSLEYVLVRILSTHGIYERIRDCCLTSADLTSRTMQSNFFMDINTLLLAVFSKLYYLSGIMGNKCVDLYKSLQQNTKQFPQQQQISFLPQGTILPEPTALRIFDNNLNEEQPSLESLEGMASSVNLINTPIAMKSKSPIVSNLKKMTQKIDEGEKLQRKDVTKTNRPEITAKIDFTQLNSVEGIRKFIVEEHKNRKTNIKTSSTHNIANHEWAGAVKLFESKLNKDGHTKAISFLKKFLSSKK